MQITFFKVLPGEEEAKYLPWIKILNLNLMKTMKNGQRKT